MSKTLPVAKPYTPPRSKIDAARLAPRAVVVTGLGTTNPLGGDIASTWQALREGNCAVRKLNLAQLGGYELSTQIAAPLAVEPQQELSAKELRRLDRSSQCALISARQAWEQAFTTHPVAKVSGSRLAVSISPGMGAVLSVMHTWDVLRQSSSRRILPTAIPALMPNAPAATVGIEFGARAGIHAPVAACASGAQALSYGADLITANRADVVIAGGTDAALHPMTFAAFGAMRALSTRNSDPQTASRPFAPDRDGFVLGEGAGILILEAAEHAAARGADVLAVLAGSAVNADAYDIARPEPSGHEQERALRQALQRAGIAATEVGYVNAHATSTPAGDIVEAQVLARTVPQAAISATKSATGHLLGGCGGLEAIFTVLALVDQWIPPTLLPGGIDQRIAELGLDIVGMPGRTVNSLSVAASTSFGFGGHNVALIFTR